MQSGCDGEGDRARGGGDRKPSPSHAWTLGLFGAERAASRVVASLRASPLALICDCPAVHVRMRVRCCALASHVCPDRGSRGGQARRRRPSDARVRVRAVRRAPRRAGAGRVAPGIPRPGAAPVRSSHGTDAETETQTGEVTRVGSASCGDSLVCPRTRRAVFRVYCFRVPTHTSVNFLYLKLKAPCA